MAPDSPAIQRLTREILAFEAAPSGRSPHAPEVAASACDKLRSTLVVFFGLIGYRSLLGRALTLAKAGDPSLAALRIADDASLEGFDDPPAPTASELRPAAPGAGLILAHILCLLVTFIGESLTIQLARRAWPGLPDGMLSSAPEDNP